MKRFNDLAVGTSSRTSRVLSGESAIIRPYEISGRHVHPADSKSQRGIFVHESSCKNRNHWAAGYIGGDEKRIRDNLDPYRALRRHHDQFPPSDRHWLTELKETLMLWARHKVDIFILDQAIHPSIHPSLNQPPPLEQNNGRSAPTRRMR